MRKNIFIALFCTMWSYNTLAQFGNVLNLQKIDKQLYHFGYYLGVNYNDFTYKINKNAKFKNEDDFSVVQHFGLEVGILANLRLHELIDVRVSPGVSYFQRNLVYPKKILEHYKKTYSSLDVNDTIRQINSTYLNIPLSIKFNAIRLNNYRPYLTANICYSYNFTSNQNSEDDNFAKVFRSSSHMFSYGFGFGIEFYCPYFKVSTEINTVFGINNILIKDGKDGKKQSPWTDSFSQLRTKGINLKIIFQ